MVMMMLPSCPDRFWWLKINALAEREDWEELEKFSKGKKSPIGYLVRKGKTSRLVALLGG